jgi:hypothetical protein
MTFIANTYGLGMPRITAWAVPDPSDPKYLDYLADDRQFLAALSASMAPNNIARGSPEAYNAILDAAGANVGNLSLEERAQIIESARRIPAAGYRSDPTKPAEQIVKSIGVMSNNQGYTGPDAGVVVGTTPTASGYPKPITRSELLDNENFGNLVNQVFAAAAGKPAVPDSMMTGTRMFQNTLLGVPQNFFSSDNNGWSRGVDITKLSESERMTYLNKVAEFGKDGSISGEESAALLVLATELSRGGANEPIAVTSTGYSFSRNSGAISNDDLMENSTFEKQLNSIVLWGADSISGEAKALKDAIATADYDSLGYEERVALIQAFNAATSDNNVTAKEIAGITQMLEEFQKSSNSSSPTSSGTTLSNGVIVSDSDVKSDDNFASMVNEVLDRSGVEVPKTDPHGYGGSFSNNRYTVPMLRGLEVSELTPEQRIEVLEMISQAGSDREVTRDEANAILTRVNEMSGRGSYPFYFGYVA